MSDYNSKRKTGGRNNSKIDNQDSVAAIYAVELLSNPNIFKFNVCIDDFNIVCEGNEDIEIMNDDYHIFIQVKSTKLSGDDFKAVLEFFLENKQIEIEKQTLFVISAFEPIIINKVNFTDRLLDYLKVKNNKFENCSRKDSIKKALIANFDLGDYEEIIDSLYIDNRPLFRDIEDTRAIFARYLRLAYGFKDQGEERTDALFNALCDKFAELRRNRNHICRTELETILGKELCKASWYSGLSLILGYTKIENGYVKDSQLYTKRIIVENGVKKAYKRVMRGWRKAYLTEFLLSMLISAKRCPQCGHPMMANLNGLNGIACPDCGFNPYVSIILCCECGDYEVIKTQPDISADSLFNYINDYFRTRKDTVCKHCEKELLDEFVELRTIMLPIPIPFDEYKNIDVIYKNSPY